jgi:hypothetical protein
MSRKENHESAERFQMIEGSHQASISANSFDQGIGKDIEIRGGQKLAF